MILSINSKSAGLFDPKRIKQLLLSFFIISLLLALIVAWFEQSLTKEEAQMQRLTESILQTEGDVRELREMHKNSDFRAASLFWSTYAKSLLMAEQSDHLIQQTIAQGLIDTQGWEFIRLVENIEPFVMGYTPQQISAYQRLILGFKDPALEFDPGFVVDWKTCIDSFANRYDGYAGRLLYYRDMLRWKDETLCAGLKEKARKMLEG